MPYSSKQHKLFEAAAHSADVARRVGIPQATAGRMASEGINRAGGGLAQAYTGNPLDASPQNDVMMMLGNFGAVQPRQFADGGSVQTAAMLLQQANQKLAENKDNDLQDDLQRMLGGLLKKQKSPSFADGGDVDVSDLLKGAAIGIPAAMMARRPINMLARPLQRALSKPVMGFESVRDPAHAATSDLRTEKALSLSDSPYAKLPVWKGQGAFMNPQGALETNPLYAQELPRTPGRLDKNEDMLRYAGEIGNDLQQWGVPIQRAMPNFFDIPSGADSLLMKGMGPEEIKKLAQAVPNETIVSHRPGNKALVFSAASPPPDIRDLRKLIEQVLPSARARYAVSRPGVDRVLVGEEPWMDRSYKDLGLR